MARLLFVLTDDWELRGDGSGDPEKLQFSPMREVVRIFNDHGIRSSFNAEMLQQLFCRRHQHKWAKLGHMADRWDEVVRETYLAGHDVQLHLHTQWSKAEYQDDRFQLSGAWPMTAYSPDELWTMLAEGKTYLESILKPLNPAYQCVSFRAGSWKAAPSTHLFPTLSKLGIKLDLSIVGGFGAWTRNVEFDYRYCEESFLPYYPVMTDARAVSTKMEPIVCVPTQHFYESRWSFLRRVFGGVFNRIRSRPAPSEPSCDASYAEWNDVRPIGIRVYEKFKDLILRGRHHVADLSELDSNLLNEMLAFLIEKADQTGIQEIPLVIENHTKQLADFSIIRLFADKVSKMENVEFLSLSGLSQAIDSGRVVVRRKETV